LRRCVEVCVLPARPARVEFFPGAQNDTPVVHEDHVAGFDDGSFTFDHGVHGQRGRCGDIVGHRDGGFTVVGNGHLRQPCGKLELSSLSLLEFRNVQVRHDDEVLAGLCVCLTEHILLGCHDHNTVTAASTVQCFFHPFGVSAIAIECGLGELCDVAVSAVKHCETGE